MTYIRVPVPDGDTCNKCERLIRHDVSMNRTHLMFECKVFGVSLGFDCKERNNDEIKVYKHIKCYKGKCECK